MSERLSPMYRKFYLTRKPAGTETYEEIYKKCLAEIMQYYETHGKDGFLSERIANEEIVPRATKIAEHRYRTQGYTLSMEFTIINRSREEEDLKAIEGKPNFIRWIGPDDVKIIVS